MLMEIPINQEILLIELSNKQIKMEQSQLEEQTQLILLGMKILFLPLSIMRHQLMTKLIKLELNGAQNGILI